MPDLQWRFFKKNQGGSGAVFVEYFEVAEYLPIALQKKFTSEVHLAFGELILPRIAESRATGGTLFPLPPEYLLLQISSCI